MKKINKEGEGSRRPGEGVENPTLCSLVERQHLPVIFCGFISFLFDLITVLLFSLCNFSLKHLVPNEPETGEAPVTDLQFPDKPGPGSRRHDTRKHFHFPLGMRKPHSRPGCYPRLIGSF